MRFLRTLLALGAILATLPAGAATWMVAPDGSDEDGNGSSGSPWATITHALDQADSGDLVLVRPGLYEGRVRLRGEFSPEVTVRSEIPYQARLRHDGTVITCYYGQGIVLEGFDVAHLGAGSDALVIQIQDLRDEPGGDDRTGRITLRNNVLHDSFNNDILKINNGAELVTVEGNLFYNQTGSDEHIDINSVTDVTVQDNVFFNHFEASGRVNGNDTSSYIVIKDSNEGSDGILGSHGITVRRNVFLHWEGSTGSNFVLIGEDGQPYHEGYEILVENNLLLGDSTNVMRAPFGVKGGRDIVFRYNTVVGDLPSLAYAMRLNSEGENPPNEGILMMGCLWSDPTGTMGAEEPGRPNDFSDAPPGETLTFTLAGNLYWNGQDPIPTDAGELVNYTDDPTRLVADPQLPGQAGLVPPAWDAGEGRFADGSTTIRQVFERLVDEYGLPGADSPVLDAGFPPVAPEDDILGRPRPQGSGPDLGAVERPASGTPSPTPEPTTVPTPSPLLDLALWMPSTEFRTGEICRLDLTVTNPGPDSGADLYVLLAVAGEYFCYPSWAPATSYLDHESRTFGSGQEQTLSILPAFGMPPVEPLGPLVFVAACFEPGTPSTASLVSNVPSWEFWLR